MVTAGIYLDFPYPLTGKTTARYRGRRRCSYGPTGPGKIEKKVETMGEFNGASTNGGLRDASKQGVDSDKPYTRMKPPKQPR
ncbi:hypothetical protein HPP92_014029 [Vanilla planifolia]|uniref:Uncharacterized protein n=1 Tax=Vanilla planifolia TaxID=51239 RepID=A0A835QML1_VANPL|nr:hypothetical protein HPP92_014461 [Vanilla planifolia]KAG0474343.1 hypothetical protein HPP92_014029 [Vanilla planifolia]